LLEVARRWSVMAKQHINDRGVGLVRRREVEPEWEGIPPLQPRGMDKGAWAANVADIHGGAWATGAWLSSCRAHVRPVSGHRLSGTSD
jgi:hypothetical protein